MRRLVYYGYNDKGEFQIKVIEQEGSEQWDQEVSLTRAESNRISNHMKFGKKTQERVIETVDGVVLNAK